MASQTINPAAVAAIPKLLQDARSFADRVPVPLASNSKEATRVYRNACILADAGEIERCYKVLCEGASLMDSRHALSRTIPGTAGLEYIALSKLYEQSGAFDGDFAQYEPVVLNQLGFGARAMGKSEEAANYLQRAFDFYVEGGQGDRAAGTGRALVQTLVNSAVLDPLEPNLRWGKLLTARNLSTKCIRLADAGIAADGSDLFMIRATRATEAHVVHMMALQATDLGCRMALLRESLTLFQLAESHEQNAKDPMFGTIDKGRLTSLPGSQFVLLLLDCVNYGAQGPSLSVVQNLNIEAALARAQNGYEAAITRGSGLNQALDRLMIGLCYMASGNFVAGEVSLELGKKRVDEFDRGDMVAVIGVDNRVNQYRAAWVEPSQ